MVLDIANSRYNCMEIYKGNIKEAEFEVFQLKPYHTQKFLVIRKEVHNLKTFVFSGLKNLENLVDLIYTGDDDFSPTTATEDKHTFFEDNYMHFITKGIPFREYMNLC